MTTYSIFERRADEAPASVPEKFSWFAALLPPVYAVAHGLWIELLGWGVVVVALVALAPYIGSGAAFWLYVLFAILIGLEASALRRGALRRGGWRHAAEIVAAEPDVAEVEWIKRRHR